MTIAIRGSPSIGVFIPVFNDPDRVTGALGSVAAQDRPADEIVVVDDGSTDGTPARVQTWARETGRHVELVRQPNRGPAAACQTALRESGSDLLVRLDADDLLLPHHLRTLERGFLNRPDLVLCFGNARRSFEDGRDVDDYFSGTAVEETGWRPLGLRLRRPTDSLFAALVGGSFIATCAAMFSRRAALAAGGWDPDLRVAEDRDFWLRLSRRGPAAYTPEPMAVVRYHGDNLTHPRHAVRSHRFRLAVTNKMLRLADDLGLGPSERRRARRARDRAARSYLYWASRKGARAWARACRRLVRDGPASAVLDPKAPVRALWSALTSGRSEPTRGSR